MLRWGKLEVSGGFLLVAAVLFYFDTGNILPLAAFAAGAHELGHYAALRLLGGDIVRFRLTAVGGDMELDRSRPLSYLGELLSITAGPLVNLAVAVLSAKLAGGREWLYVLSGLSLSLGLFNLLPVYPLDGGRTLLLLLTGLLPPLWAARLTRWCSAVVVAGVLVVGGFLFFQSPGNFTLLVMGLWLLTGLIPPEARKKEGFHRKRACN